jgi:putative ubiquitin-RnfH superfamily antitoxin RatB of RatAB toxin-antitoxin module
VKVQLVRAWPRRFEVVEVELPADARVREAVAMAGWSDDPEVVGYAVFGQRVDVDGLLREGDRVELLRPLLADPKDARRQRVEERRRSAKK